ncbi:MAG: ATP-dependent metallopeptidase FtsH/Yme1/Tma family protein [Ignavibacteriae bacterium]|nr:ATP-dependent metallopeptidase FtsH/Yme1/Tma family protein [Ignavibacteriota bacterium]
MITPTHRLPRSWNAGGDDNRPPAPTPPRKAPQNRKPGDDNTWLRSARAVLIAGGMLLLAFIIFSQLFNTANENPEISYSDFQKILTGERKTPDGQELRIIRAKVEKANLNDFTLTASLNTRARLVGVNGKTVESTGFVVKLGTLDAEMRKSWLERGIEVTFDEKDSIWTNTFFTLLPWLLFIGAWIFLMRRMQGGGAAGGTKGLFSFGKSRARMATDSTIRVTFSDVAGADEAKVELQEIIEFLREPARFQRLGGKIPRGVLLLGPPGTGKTLLARAVAGEAGVPFFSISGAEFVEMFVGVGASRVRDLFETAKKNSPCIVFIDEIDAVGRQRGAGLGGGHDEREQTLNQLLVEMDGFEQGSTVIIIAATNRPDVLDPALLRPGRFDRQVVVDRPDVKGREGILKVHTRSIPLDPDVSLETLAKGTPGLAGAELANLVNEAALLAARRNKKTVAMMDFEEAKDKVMMGMERKSLIISEQEKRLTAYHEAGHVLVAKMLPEADPVHKVTIIPRGRALGVTTYLPIDEKHTYSKEYLEAMITYAMGGRAAEMLVFGQLTTGAGNDIERASSLARKMVCEWGMSELGPLTFGAKEEEIFLGREIVQHRDYSEETAVAIDSAVRAIVLQCMKRAEDVLSENRAVLDRIALALLEREILDSEEIDKLMRGEELPPAQRNGGGLQQKVSEIDALRMDQERSDRIRRAVEELKRQENPESEAQADADERT